MRFRSRIRRRTATLAEPLSRALVPLILGLTRRTMLRSGVSSHERTMAGINCHYYHLPARSGALGIPVVLIHGIADRATTWALTIRGMARIGPVYALDLPGFGQSSYPPGRRYATLAEQVAVVQSLIYEVLGAAPLLVGNSMGGWISLRLAELSPELTRGAVLLDPGGALLEGRGSWENFVRTVQVADLSTVRQIYRQMYGRTPIPLYLAQHSFRELFRRDAVQNFVTASNEEDFFTAEDLRRISVPTALIWGERDAFLPAGSFEFFRDNLPTTQVLRLPGCGHLPQIERPREVVRFIRSFAEGLSNTPSEQNW